MWWKEAGWEGINEAGAGSGFGTRLTLTHTISLSLSFTRFCFDWTLRSTNRYVGRQVGRSRRGRSKGGRKGEREEGRGRKVASITYLGLREMYSILLYSETRRIRPFWHFYSQLPRGR